MAEPTAGDCSAARSRLGGSLIRLHRSLTAATHVQHQGDDVLDTFRRRWWKGRRRIADRLRMIDTHLDSLRGVRPAAGPRFAIVGAAAETDESQVEVSAAG